MSDSLWAVQVAVKAKLDADTTIKSLLGSTPRIYDDVQQNATFPYLTIGEATGVEWDTKSNTGMEQTLTLHAWSRYRGRKEAKDILAAVYAALHRQTLTVTGHSFIDCFFEFEETYTDPDGLTRHGVARYRVTTQQSGA